LNLYRPFIHLAYFFSPDFPLPLTRPPALIPQKRIFLQKILLLPEKSLPFGRIPAILYINPGKKQRAIVKWFKITMSLSEVAGDEPGRLRRLFSDLLMAAEDTRGMALFSTDSSLTEFYLCCSRHSFPYVHALTDYYESHPCDKPKHQSLILIAGHATHLTKLLQTNP
jgi:hypothetical protein